MYSATLNQKSATGRKTACFLLISAEIAQNPLKTNVFQQIADFAFNIADFNDSSRSIIFLLLLESLKSAILNAKSAMCCLRSKIMIFSSPDPSESHDALPFWWSRMRF